MHYIDGTTEKNDINAKDGSVDEAARLTRSSVEFRMRGLAVASEGDAWRLMLEEPRRGSKDGSVDEAARLTWSSVEFPMRG